MHILIVDDSEDGRDVAEAILTTGGFNDVTVLGSARDAYLFLEVGQDVGSRVAPVDLVLLDIIMPQIDGIQACARIRKEPRYADVPIIMMTAIDDVGRLADAFAAGANDYITKPLNRTELLARARAAVKLKSELERRRQSERELLLFMSSWGNRRATNWIDETTGLFVGEVAEAYLGAVSAGTSNAETSVVALAVDRLDTYRAQGSGVAAGILALVANAVRSTIASVGVVAGTYPNGTIALVGPSMDATRAVALGEALRASVARLDNNTESTAAGKVTASVAVVSGRTSRSDRINLLTRAVTAVPSIAASGGDRVVPVQL
jgi:sigma-B regulation protein RsbU (phosphoserine phosphatase)